MISFRMSADQKQYRVGERATIQFIVVNQGSRALYMGRDVGTCSKWTGHTELQILNAQSQKLPGIGCESYIALLPGAKLKEIITHSDSWVLLKPHDIYGTEESIDLPTQQGTYKVFADLWPPGLSTEESDNLAAEHIRVLQSRHSAKPLEIVVR